MRTLFRGIALLLVLAACRSGSETKETASNEHEVLPFLADDPAGAIAVAKERKLPIFVDSWAPW